LEVERELLSLYVSSLFLSFFCIRLLFCDSLIASYSPQITEAAVVGLPSEQWGQKVAAVVVLHPDAATSSRNGKSWGPMDMRRALKERLASYKIPSEMKVLDAIPRNAMGKGEFFFGWKGRMCMDDADYLQLIRRRLLKRFLMFD
jgi:hypothetical protein